MRKILTFVCCAMVLLSVSSCTKQYITPNPNTTYYADLATSDWSVYTNAVTGSKSYQAPIDIHAITDNFTQYGGVVVSISYDGGNTYEQVPEVYDNISYSFTYNQGNLTLYAQTSDGWLPTKAPDPIKVKIILVSSN